MLANTLEVAKLRARYNIVKPNSKFPATKEKNETSKITIPDNLKNESPVIDSTIAVTKEVRSAKIIHKEVSQKVVVTHTIKKGETLYAISIKYKVTVNEIKKWNNLKSNVLYIGQKIKILITN